MHPAARTRRARGWCRLGAPLLSTALLVLLGCAGRTAAEKAEAGPPDLAVRYVCNDGTRFVARFVFAEPRHVLIERHGREPLNLARQDAADGFRYGDGRHLLTGQEDAAAWTEQGRAPATCFTKNPPPPYVPGSALTRPAS